MTIDGFDISSFAIASEAYKEFFSYPSLKKVDENDWPDEDGIEMDLSNPRLDSTSIQIKFALINMSDYYDFVRMFARSGAYHNVEVLGITKKLRVTDYSSIESVRELGVFSVTYCDDFPLDINSDDEVYSAPILIGMADGDIAMDNINLSGYGIRVLAGTLDSVRQAPAIKENLLNDSIYQSGKEYDPAKVLYKSKDVTLNLFMKMPLSTWKVNYKAFLWDLIRPNSRSISAYGKTYPAAYKSSKISEFAVDNAGNIWCKFDVTMTFTSVSINGTEYILYTEDNYYVITEDGLYLVALD